MGKVLLTDNIQIPEKPDGPGMDGNGVYAFIYRGSKVKAIEKAYGRKNCCVKIFKNIYPFNENDPWWAGGWKGSSLKEAVAIQNIYSMFGLAPRVFGTFVANLNGDNHWAYLTEDLGHWTEENNDIYHEEIINRMKVIGEEYGIIVFDDGRKWNAISGKYVDFQGFRFTEDYKEKLKNRLIGVANVGKWGPFMNYHNIPELDITGGRDNEYRIKELHLDEIDFEGKTVLDVGCSEGFFCRYAIDRGAKRVVGLDLPGVIDPVRELTYYLGYNNIDYLEYDLKKEIPDIGKFDITLFLSMVHHIGLPKWVINSTKQLLVFEGNGKNEDQQAIIDLDGQFMGNTFDLLERPVIWKKYSKK